MTVDQLLQSLPHGSGIDGDWEIEDSGDSWVACNAYHEMNDVGMYVAWKEFELYIPKDAPLNFDLRVGDGDYDLQEYIGDTVFWSLYEALQRNR